MNSIPSALASRGERISTGWLLILIVPPSRAIAPPRIFISVDLPAPFSPINATISPAPTLRLTLLSATTPGNRLLTSSIWSMGGFSVTVFAADEHGRHGFNALNSLSVSVSICGLASPTELIDLFLKSVDVGFLDCQRRHENLFARGHDRLVAVQVFRHQLDRAITKLVRLLHDSRVNRSFLNAFERRIFFVERDDLHLTGFVCFLDGAENRGTVVGPQADRSD